jgi:O-antigen/teichoic acid export membrane protein
MAELNFKGNSKFIDDSKWNYGSFTLIAISGVILNICIVMKLGVESLGVFNQVYAVFVISSHLAVLGVHESVQKHVAQYTKEENLSNTISLAGLILVSGCGLMVAVTMYCLSETIGRVVNSASIGQGIALTTPGLFLFAVNKVLMAALNGERRMKVFAIAQSIRALAILISGMVIVWSTKPSYTLGASFTIAEIVLVLPLLLTVYPSHRRYIAWPELSEWIHRHMCFGLRVLPNGFLSESYLRIDILMLSIFVSDHMIGIYSFAALFVEGLYQIPVVVRTIANPILVRLVKLRKSSLHLVCFCRRMMLFSSAIFIIVAGIVLFVFPLLGPFFPAQLIEYSYPVLIILVMGLLVYSAFIPLDFIFIQAGMPGRQSIFMTWNVSINALLNLILIPDFGIIGAAWATALSFILSSLTLSIAMRIWLHLPEGILLVGRNQQSR